MPRLSAGLVAYRVRDDKLEVLLVHPGGPLWENRDDHAWSIPKGEYDDGTDPLREAEREFAEELGVRAPAGPRLDLGTIRQASGKRVKAWAVEANSLVIDKLVSNEFEMEWPPRSGRTQSFPEVDQAEWMAISEAIPRIVEAQAAFLGRLVNQLSEEGVSSPDSDKWRFSQPTIRSSDR